MPYTTLPEIGDFGVLMTASLLKQIKENLDYLKSPPRYIYTRPFGAPDYSISSTSFVDLDATNLAATLTFTGEPVLVTFYCGRLNYSSSPTFYTLNVDGANIGNGNSGLGYIAVANVPISFSWVITGLSAGQHTIKFQARVTAGTMTFLAANGIQFIVTEI